MAASASKVSGFFWRDTSRPTACKWLSIKVPAHAVQRTAEGNIILLPRLKEISIRRILRELNIDIADGYLLDGQIWLGRNRFSLPRYDYKLRGQQLKSQPTAKPRAADPDKALEQRVAKALERSRAEGRTADPWTLRQGLRLGLLNDTERAAAYEDIRAEQRIASGALGGQSAEPTEDYEDSQANAEDCEPTAQDYAEDCQATAEDMAEDYAEDAEAEDAEAEDAEADNYEDYAADGLAEFKRHRDLTEDMEDFLIEKLTKQYGETKAWELIEKWANEL